MKNKLTKYNKMWIQLLAKKTNPKFLREIKALGFKKVQNGVYQAIEFRNSVSNRIAKLQDILKEAPGVDLSIQQFSDKQHENMITLK